jgi:hypothetical protein
VISSYRGSNLFRFLALISLTAAALFGQGAASRGTVQGTVKDATGGIIRSASVTLATDSGTVQTVTSGADGNYVFHNVGPGNYTISATFKGLQQANASIVSVTAGATASANLTLVPAAQKEVVNVNDSATNLVSTEPANNQSAIVLSKEDIDALPDDPDDLQADLQALAGPSAGPGGSQIYVDGFTGGRLPPKESIREIRINSNPFSAEFDKLGYGRIQIFTKPGSDKFHGQAYYNISDGIWNSRNPFLPVAPPFRTQLFGGNVSGPLGKKASFFIDVERRLINDNDIVNATIPTSTFTGTVLDHSYYSTPQRRTTISPRVDYALGANHTLSFRYSYLDNEKVVTFANGNSLPATSIGDLSFPSGGYNSATTQHSFQMVETSVLSPKAVNETHVNVERDYSDSVSQSNSPSLMVAQSFTGGGSGYSASGYANTYDREEQAELQNYTSLTLGPQTIKFGIRVRTDVLSNSSPSNFNGTYSFLGGAFPYSSIANLPGAQGLTVTNGLASLTSIQQFLFTEQLLALNQPLGGLGPSKYSVSIGNPYIRFYQMDFGPFIQDDWKVRPNLTMSFGLRYEAQNDIPDHNDWAPRFGFAWSPGSKANGASRPKTVFRGGWGMFYDRFAIANVENANRYAGGSPLETTYTAENPTITGGVNFFANPLPLSQLQTSSGTPLKYEIDGNLRSPRLMQLAVGVDRQLFSRTTLSVNFVNSRGNHELRTVDVNSPLPQNGEYPLQIQNCITANGAASCPALVRPFAFDGDIYDYQSSGTFKQTQLLFNVNTQIGKYGTLFGRYSLASAHSDTDGLGSIPSDPYNFAQDWGRSSLDITNNFFLGGSLTAKWGLRFSPFIVAHTGTPYNLTTGTDLYLQNAETARPSFYITNPPTSIGATEYKTFLNPTPAIGGIVVPRNLLTGPGFLGINLRVSKTWGFGTTKFAGPSGGSRGGGGGSGGRGGGGGFGGGGPRGGGGGGETTQHRYNLTVSINARNILNHENVNSPTGVMTSPYFLEATGIQGGYGAEGTSSNQRRIDLQLRFAF